MSPQNSSFKAAPFIREIGRGKKGARDMSQSDARAVYEAMLERQISDLELGALLIGMRINRFWAVHHWLPVLLSMPRMLRELGVRLQFPDVAAGLRSGSASF